MDVVAIRQQIKDKKTDHVFFFTGQEIEVQKIYINQIAKVNGLNTVYLDSISEVWSKLNKRTMFSSPTCYVVRDDKDMLDANNELYKKIYDVVSDNIVIFTFTSVDKRTKMYKAIKSKVVTFEPLKTPVLVKYVQREINLSTENATKLIEICENDYGRILLEIDKIRQYGQFAFPEVGNTDNFDANRAFTELLSDGTIYQPPKDAIFDFVGAVLKRQVLKSFSLMQECYDCGEATMVMLSVLYTNTKQLLQVQACDSKDIAKVTGLSWWQIKNAKGCIGRYTDDELIDLMLLIQKCESGIKRGLIDEAFVIEYILVHTL